MQAVRRVLYKLAFPFAYFLLRRFRPHHPAACCLIERSGKVLLIQNTYGPGTWAYPGGRMKRGEAPEGAARREIREELGITLEEILYLGESRSLRRPGPARSRTFCFYFTAPASLEINPNKSEIKNWGWFSPEDFPEDRSPVVSRAWEFLKHGASGDPAWVTSDTAPASSARTFPR